MTDLALTGPLRARESNLWVRDAHDWYVEPEWVSRRLFQTEPFNGHITDPAAGIGRIVNAANSCGYPVHPSDIVVRPGAYPGTKQADFMSSLWFDDLGMACTPDNIVSNPPFGICDTTKDRRGFVEECLERARSKVALLLPCRWMCGHARSVWLQTTPLYRVYILSPRPSMPPGHLMHDPKFKAGGGQIDYAWFVWLKGFSGPWTGHWLRRDP